MAVNCWLFSEMPERLLCQRESERRGRERARAGLDVREFVQEEEDTSKVRRLGQHKEVVVVADSELQEEQALARRRCEPEFVFVEASAASLCSEAADADASAPGSQSRCQQPLVSAET